MVLSLPITVVLDVKKNLLFLLNVFHLRQIVTVQGHADLRGGVTSGSDAAEVVFVAFVELDHLTILVGADELSVFVDRLKRERFDGSCK